jgi:hypothetical protein
MPIPVAVRYKAWLCGRALAGIVGSNPAKAWMSGSFECCVLLDTGICVGLISRPEESYRLWRVSECDREASTVRRPWPTGGCCARGERVILNQLEQPYRHSHNK